MKKRFMSIITAVCIGLASSGCSGLSGGEQETALFTEYLFTGEETDTETLQTSADMSASTISSTTASAAEESYFISDALDTSAPVSAAGTIPEITTETAAEAVTSLTEPQPEQTYYSVLPETSTANELTEPASVSASSETSMAQVTIVTLPSIPEETVTAVQNSVTSAKGSTYYPENEYYPLNFKEQRAMWLSYLEFDRLMRGKSEEEFTLALEECFDNMVSIGLNTVYFQARAYGDAYYNSALFPKADRLTGDYDPLAIAVKLAHDKGLSIHAWINPLRLMTDTDIKNIPEGYTVSDWYASDTAKGTLMVNHAGRWYLNPAYTETVELICYGVMEIVSNYNVDGVQIDDYFYPTTDESFDAAAYAASGTELSLADWRRQNVTNMVKSIYSAVHSANRNAVFGISPSGNIDNDRSEMYADVELWLSEPGCCDYICPQIYYGFLNEACPFEETCRRWKEAVKLDSINLVIGIAAYKTGTEDKYAGSGRYEWQDNRDIIARQCAFAKELSAGYALFRYDSLFLPDPSVAVYASDELKGLS